MATPLGHFESYASSFFVAQEKGMPLFLKKRADHALYLNFIFLCFVLSSETFARSNENLDVDRLELTLQKYFWN